MGSVPRMLLTMVTGALSFHLTEGLYIENVKN
jgi:hypothetical protein